MNVIHLILIILLTISGFISLLAGLLVIAWRRTGWLFQTYLWPLLLTMIACMLVLAWDWPVLTIVARSVYIGLSLVMIYTVYRAFMAREKQFHRYTGWRLEFMDEVSITLCLLFIVLTTTWIIDLQLPLWIVALIVAASVWLGKLWLQREKQLYLAERTKRKSRRSE